LAVNEIKHWDFLETKTEDKDVKNANYETNSVYGLGHPLYYQNVIDTMRGVAEPETDGREGLRSLEILIAAYISSRDGKRVSLPLNY
jgi:UDP-N-acetyl-2-amino-2-deoxyglucuronate dehydrogenase